MPPRDPVHPRRVSVAPITGCTSDAEAILRVELRAAANNLLNTWRIESEAAARLSAASPGSPSAGCYGLMALAGNMLWAATALMPGADIIELAAMSFVGAAAGAAPGLLTVYENPAPIQSNIALFQQLISTRLALVKDRVDVSAIVDRAFEELVTRRGLTGSERASEREHGLWNMMFTSPDSSGSAGLQMRALTASGRLVRLGTQLAVEYEAEKSAAADREVASTPMRNPLEFGFTHAAEARAVDLETSARQAALRRLRGADPFPAWLDRRGTYRALAAEFGLVARP